jgi:adenosylhomocysteine nucleosidase
MSETTQVRLPDSGGGGPVGVVCALPGELGGLRELVISEETRQGMRLLRMATGGSELLAVVSGIGKVRAAQAATLLLEGGARGLLVVGTCGGLRGHLGPGTLVHCTRAVQTDLAVREGREVAPSPDWLAAWQDQVPGRAGWFLTADRPVLSTWRRIRLARAFAGDCVADMETAAIAAVAEAAGTPWAALRAVTDRANLAGAASFRRHYAEQAGRAADTIPGLISRLG